MSPFGASTSRPGHGTIVLSILPPSTPVLETLSYQYPLKLIAPDAIPLPEPSQIGDFTDGPTLPYSPLLVHTVFILTYGGGLVAGDTIDLHITLAPTTRLALLTQGSTKIFKTPSRDLVSGQRMSVDLSPSSALCYLPDPVQPFAHSAFSQVQTYNLEGGQGSLCVCDWVCEGRSARGEKWSFYSYASKNEVWAVSSNGARRLLLRDNLILDKSDSRAGGGFVERMDGFGVFGTLILYGPVFSALGSYFLSEFTSLPRIGGRKWDIGVAEAELSAGEMRRVTRQRQEAEDGLIWTAASHRGFVLVKFGAREVEGARRWLSGMVRGEGSVVRSFGERALLCLK
ncbi:urease accessory protein-like protein UreD [Lepidopterella palustris CBS 459.81]|uniref:Urease accessory protein-like protein UreD n=1 Tax=Lepidopterella palustris CBS 459.81 TaxID=1314670 RepID=A0A8E2E2Q6_9PEZI|nr:urease accessory protein-like protein UreD [Lepidopterella palustris CBS 459.81]